MKKYIITGESKDLFGSDLYRIVAVKDFSLITGEKVKVGDKGGWVSSYDNLSQEGNCWIKDEAVVCDNARVIEDALVCDRATVTENALIRDNAAIKDKVIVRGKVTISNNAVISEWACIYDNALIVENAKVRGSTFIHEEAIIKGNAEVFEGAEVKGFTIINGNAKVYGEAKIRGEAKICGEARVYGTALIKYPHPITKDIREDLIQYIAASLNVYPVRGKYYLYKKVNKVRSAEYASIFDKGFIYKLGEYVEAKDANEDFLVSCDTGLHVSNADYWMGAGDTLIQVEVKIEDIITCMEGKLRVKKLKVIDEIWSKN